MNENRNPIFYTVKRATNKISEKTSDAIVEIKKSAIKIKEENSEKQKNKKLEIAEQKKKWRVCYAGKTYCH